MKTIKTYIFGCSGIAKSIIDTLTNSDLRIDGSLVVVDKDASLASSDFYRGVPAICIEAFERLAESGQQFVIAYFKPENVLDRLEFARYLVDTKGLFPLTVVDAAAIVSPTAQIGDGCYIGPGVVLDSDVNIGHHTTILFNSVISRECNISENNFISAGVVVKGGVSIGHSNFISASCNLLRNLGSYNFLNAGVRHTNEEAHWRIIFNTSDQKEIVISDNPSTARKQLRFLS